MDKKTMVNVLEEFANKYDIPMMELETLFISYLQFETLPLEKETVNP